MQYTRTLLVVAFLNFVLGSCKPTQKMSVDLANTKWIHGAADCSKSVDSPIQIVQLNRNTWVLRQNKCIHYEAPFLYLFIGATKALLMDTGATEDEQTFPLYKTVKNIIARANRGKPELKLVVAHTHAHSDHIAADNQFTNKPGTTVIGLSVNDVKSFFGIGNWPAQTGMIDLGGRVLNIIPIPGHQQASIAVYDRQTKLLLTGDSFYPGRLYINDWPAFVASTQRLVDFVSVHPVTMLLGNHIEMKNTAGEDYATGTIFQPNEHSLPLTLRQLTELNDALKKAGDKPAREIHNDFIIYPN